MEISKKPKRPRIGESQEMNTENGHVEKVTYNPNSTFNSSHVQNTESESVTNEHRNDYRERSYGNQPNYNSQQGGYNNYNRYNNNRQQGGYGNYGNRSPRPYNNNRSQGGYNNYGNRQQGGYGNYARQQDGGYQSNELNQQQESANYNSYQQGGGYGNRQQGGYNNRQQGSYNHSQGGYNNRQGGYNRQQGGYNNRQQGGFNNQQGGYGNRPQGGFNHPQGGYNRQQGGGYNNRQGGYNRPQQGGFNKRGGNFNRQGGQRFTPRPQPVVYEVPEMDPNEETRLNKFMANAGICSRREADELIQKGLVKVNGVAVTELGTKIKRDDVVEYNDKVVTLENKCYILLNKPKDCVTTSEDPDGRLTVMDLVKNACKERIYPVGRLDRNTTGVLLLTNDGDLASKLTHPKYVKKKIYQVWTDKDIAEDDMQRLADGIELEDGPIHADAISYVNDKDKNQAGIEIHSGRNRIVRRMFESLGYRVTKLDRVYFAGLTKKNLPRGRWRYLSQEEVNFLKQGSFE